LNLFVHCVLTWDRLGSRLRGNDEVTDAAP
jgi:hypothetical protein